MTSGILFKAADALAPRAQILGLMLQKVLKENIDGEALMWAHQRLLPPRSGAF